MRFTLLLLLLLVACSRIPYESGPPIAVHSCPPEDCAALLVDFINGSADCALYDVALPVVRDALAGSRVVTERKNGYHFPSARAPNRPALMHNKFCVKDGAVWTGSYNPTVSRMHNTVVVIPSGIVARQFSDEFDELWRDAYARKVRFPRTTFNGALVEVYFCPEDECEKRVVSVLGSANRSVRFWLYSFTSDAVADALVLRRDVGVDVSGVVGTRNRYDEFERLRSAGISVEYNRSVHDKLFIIDESIVVIGSYNPTGNGDARNDENVVIIHDAVVASRFLEFLSDQPPVP